MPRFPAFLVGACSGVLAFWATTALPSTDDQFGNWIAIYDGFFQRHCTEEYDRLRRLTESDPGLDSTYISEEISTNDLYRAANIWQKLTLVPIASKLRYIRSIGDEAERVAEESSLFDDQDLLQEQWGYASAEFVRSLHVNSIEASHGTPPGGRALVLQGILHELSLCLQPSLPSDLDDWTKQAVYDFSQYCHYKWSEEFLAYFNSEAARSQDDMAVFVRALSDRFGKPTSKSCEEV